MEIPHEKMNPDTLNAVIEEIVTRDGTDYGETEVPLQDRIRQVKARLKSGRAVLTYDEKTRTCNLIRKDRS